jgi:hypothetical protein
MTLFESTLVGIVVVVALVAVAFWVAMMRHCWLHTAPGSRERRVWLLVVALGKLPGALAYCLVRGPWSGTGASVTEGAGGPE